MFVVKSIRCLFLGGLFPKETESEIVEKSKGAIQNAANAFQWNIVEGLDQNLSEPVTVFNSLYIGSYPKRYKDCFIKTYEFHHAQNAEDLNVGFCNFFGYKHLSRRLTLKKSVKRWIKANKSEEIIIFAYAMTGVMMDSLSLAKKIDPKIKTCLIVPDLPQFMNLESKRNKIIDWFKLFDSKRMKNQKKYIDLFVLLTDQMHEKLGISNYVVVEGIAGNRANSGVKITPEQEKNILYTGTLNEKYGIIELAEAFSFIKKDNYRLIICGAGGAEQKIKYLAEHDSRIIFKGQLPHNEILELQNNATILVNPRQGSEEFTKYSFPSKNLEYLASGVPLVAYKLEGIPDEYDDYINYVPTNSIQALAETIETICELPLEERLMMGARAKEFVLNNKNKKIQAKKILDALL